MQNCPKCASSKTVKNGNHLGRQRYRCKGCGFQFTRGAPRGRPANEKAMAILLYTLGLSFNAIARIYGVATSTVMRWVRAFAEKTYEKPEHGTMPANDTGLHVVSVNRWWFQNPCGWLTSRWRYSPDFT